MGHEARFDPWALYEQMLRSRLFEQAVARLWQEGRISGEMHLATGEEAIAAGTVGHLIDGDAMALDHRGTPPLLMRGVDPVLLLREFLGHPDGLCGGMGGHMHLFSPQHLAASSGIVGASGPAAAGFALAARLLRPGHIAVAFFGEGAMNEGMLMESLHLAAAWQLPVLFVCKDDGWSITVRSDSVTSGDLAGRAESLGVPARRVDGSDVRAVWRAAGEARERLRNRSGPAFIIASCTHLEGHMLGLKLVRVARHPLAEGLRVAGPLLISLLGRKGAPPGRRVEALRIVLSTIVEARRRDSDRRSDPLVRARRELETDRTRLLELESHLAGEIATIVAQATEDTSR
jgi:hypothetical protein